jgi:hypothetical protein
MAPVPLLHIAQTAANITSVDPVFLAAAVLALAACVAAIWLPRPGTPLRTLLSRRRRRRGLSIIGMALLLFAVAPSVVPYDHLFGEHHPSGEEQAIHVSHCHVSPGTCSDAPVSSGPGQLLMNAPLVVEPAMLAVLIVTTPVVLTGISQRPEIRPPLRLAV